jgi:peroxiredoxin
MNLKRLMVWLTAGLLAPLVAAQDWVWAPEFPVGSEMIPIEAPDQNGELHTFAQLSGEKGLVLVLSRSFDWCPYCISQLQQLVEAAPRFESMGVAVATMTYDSREILKGAEEDYGTTFPLLQDVETRHVSALGILNQQYEPGHRAYGIPEPGIFLLDNTGVIRFKFAEQDYRMRPDFSLVLEAAAAL